MGFPGTVLMVSHDRAFLDNVVTSTLVFEGEGRVREYVGGYQDWLRQGGSPRLLGVAERKVAEPVPPPVVKAEVVVPPAEAAVPRKKLSYKLQRELEAIPGQIDALEAELARLQAETSDPAFYQRAVGETAPVLERLQRLQQELDGLLERWAELEAL